MRPPSSSTSSSDLEPSARGNLREAVAVAAWTLLFLAAADVAVNRLFPLPGDPRAVPRGRFAEYFHDGWSVEAKIRRAVGPTDVTSAPAMRFGWLGREVRAPRPALAGPLSVSCYGMSFSNDIANAMGRLDPTIRLQLRGTPGASPNHSYAAYQLERGGDSKVVVFGVLASTVPFLATTTSMTRSFEVPMAYTYPRYHVRGSTLEADWPPVHSLDDLRARLDDPDGWAAYASWLRVHDAYYNGFLFRHDVSDASVLVRMTRRAVAQRWQASRAAMVHGPDGFDVASPLIVALRAMVAGFAAEVRSDGKVPVVLLIEDRGYGDHLDRALAPILRRDRIAFLSTHTVCPDTDPRNFAPDGHFSGPAYDRIARRLRDLIRLPMPTR